MATLSLRHNRRRRGQALIVAVLVLFAVATLAALFVAIIGSQLAQVSRHSDVVRLRNITQAGLWLANEQLTYSMKGADWRPREGGYLFGGGHIQLRVNYWPPLDAAAPPVSQRKGRFVQIVSTAIFPDHPFLRYTMVARKPLLLTDYARFITDRFETNRPARLGVEGLELGGDVREDYISSIDGPVRSNTDLIAYGLSRIFLHTWDEEAEGALTWADLRILRDDRIEVAGGLLTDPNHPPDPAGRGGDALSLYVDDYADPRIADLFVPQDEDEAEDYAAGLPDWWRELAVLNSRVLADLPGYPTATGGWVSGPSLAVSRVQPPEIDAPHPDTQRKRYLLLTKETGLWLRDELGVDFNTGEFGWGWTNFGGIYIDNFSDIQYNHDLEALRRNLLASVGHHDTGSPAGDLREDDDAAWHPADGPPTGPADWWDKTGRYYAPPGVEIVLHGDADCPYIEIIRHDDPDEDGRYWKDEEGKAKVLYGYTPWAGGEAVCDPIINPGIDGARAIFPFPLNGVIYAEGNVRIRGIMPRVRDLQNRAVGDLIFMPYGSDDWTEGGGRSRRFDLQVVSGGSIYIEGDLLTPGSAGLLPDSTLGTDSLHGSRLALLARDYVCVNTTALNPRPAELFKPVTEGGSEYLYNDRYEDYPPGDHPRYSVFQGSTEAVLNSPAGAIGWDGTPEATEPGPLEFVYRNVRLQNESLREELTDLCLLLGHSGFHATATPGGGFTGTPAIPPAPETGSDEAAVDVRVDFENVNGTTSWPWDLVGGGLYTFLRPGVADPTTSDQSDHWYLDDDHVEFLPNDYQAMQVHVTGVPTPYLTGNDVISFTSRVSPVRHYDGDGDVDGWQIPPEDLAYALGPLAVAPPRYVEGTTEPAPPLPVRIEAMIYAQNGSWFVIPGPWFNEDPDEFGLEPTEKGYPGYREPLNIRISVYGAITENMPADLGTAAEWTSKWGGPSGQGGELFLSYQYDPLLRWPRWEQESGDPESGTWAPRFPNFPLTSEMLIWGERVSGSPAG